jgi:hypothetical protein
MIQDYKPSYTEECEEYSLLFYVDRTGGLSFPCDKEGKVDMKSLQEPAARNYQFAMEHPEKYPYAWKKIEKCVRRFRNPASGVCKCGTRILLTNDYMGACECPECGQWWNLSGQELKPVERWNDAGELDYEY